MYEFVSMLYDEALRNLDYYTLTCLAQVNSNTYNIFYTYCFPKLLDTFSQLIRGLALLRMDLGRRRNNVSSIDVLPGDVECRRLATIYQNAILNKFCDSKTITLNNIMQESESFLLSPQHYHAVRVFDNVHASFKYLYDNYARDVVKQYEIYHALQLLSYALASVRFTGLTSDMSEAQKHIMNVFYSFAFYIVRGTTKCYSEEAHNLFPQAINLYLIIRYTCTVRGLVDVLGLDNVCPTASMTNIEQEFAYQCYISYLNGIDKPISIDSGINIKQCNSLGTGSAKWGSSIVWQKHRNPSKLFELKRVHWKTSFIIVETNPWNLPEMQVVQENGSLVAKLICGSLKVCVCSLQKTQLGYTSIYWYTAALNLSATHPRTLRSRFLAMLTDTDNCILKYTQPTIICKECRRTLSAKRSKHDQLGPSCKKKVALLGKVRKK